jgi:hypothetical protein
MFAWLYRFFLVATVGLMAWAAWQMVLCKHAGPDVPLVVHWPSANLGALSLGRHEVVVRITNAGRTSRRIIGMMQGCRSCVCFGTMHDGPVAVAPGTTIAYTCELDVTGSGPLEVPIRLYLEDNGIREVEEMFRGVAVVTEDARNGAESNAK